MRLYLPLVPCNGIQASLGFWIQHRGFRILGTGPRVIRQWNLDSGFQSGFLELYRGFQSPGFRIPQEKLQSQILDSTSKNFADFRVRNPLHGAIPLSELILRMQKRENISDISKD